MAFQVGQVSHGYEFLEVIGSGGAGIAYKVRNQLADRLEILKVLSRDLQKDNERVQRFLREVKIHAHLSHPHIATFYNAFEIDGEIVMTVELVQGPSLGDLLADGPIPLLRVLDYSAQALEALEFAHANGVIHRNITPTSLVVAANGNIKVGDFELARSETDPRLTLTGMVMGPMHYIAPEQVKGLEDVDGRADVYSFGMVLYELLTGRKPFVSESQFEVMQAHVNVLPDPPSQVNPDLPPQVDQVLFKAIAKDRQYRYQSAGEFRHALDNLLPARNETPEAVSSDVAAETGPEPPPSTQSAPEHQAPSPPANGPATPAVRDADSPAPSLQSFDPWLAGLVVFVTIMLIGVLALVVRGPA